MNPQVAQEPLNRVVLQIAVPSVHLQAVIDNVEALVSGKLLGHRTVHRVVGLTLSDHSGPVTHHQTRSLQISCHLRKLELDVLVACNGRSKLFPLLDVLSCRRYAGSRSAQRTASYVQPAAIEAR